MVKDHSESERRNPLPPHGSNQQGLFYMYHPTAFVTPVMEHWLEQEEHAMVST